MRYYSVELAVRPERALSIKVLFDVATNGAASGDPRGRRLETTLLVRARSLPDAAARAIRRVFRRCRGEILAVEAKTIGEAARRLAVLGIERPSSAY